MPLWRLENEMKTVQYRVREVTRYIVTRYESDPETGSGGVCTMGEYDHFEYANRVREALAIADPGPDKVKAHLPLVEHEVPK